MAGKKRKNTKKKGLKSTALLKNKCCLLLSLPPCKFNISPIFCCTNNKKTQVQTGSCCNSPIRTKRKSSSRNIRNNRQQAILPDEDEMMSSQKVQFFYSSWRTFFRLCNALFNNVAFIHTKLQ